MRKINWRRVAIVTLTSAAIVGGYITLHRHFEPIDASVEEVYKPAEIEVVEEIEVIEKIEEVEIDYGPGLKSLGEYRVTFYDAGPCCNGSNAGVDASGHPLVAGTVACNNFPLGTHVWMNLNGMMQEFVVRDRMAKKYTGKNCIDVFVDTDHHTINELGVIYTDLMIQE